jgi:transcriptional regulator GlxA family with amidase domain
MEGSAVFWGQKIQQALEIIDANLGDRLTLQYLAGLLDMSPYHFAHRFKRAVGTAPHQYVIQRRVERAKALLAFTNLPISDIALTVGCASQSHFSALFLRATGVTPQRYRSVRSDAAANRARFRYTGLQCMTSLAGRAPAGSRNKLENTRGEVYGNFIE